MIDAVLFISRIWRKERGRKTRRQNAVGPKTGWHSLMSGVVTTCFEQSTRPGVSVRDRGRVRFAENNHARFETTQATKRDRKNVYLNGWNDRSIPRKRYFEFPKTASLVSARPTFVCSYDPFVATLCVRRKAATRESKLWFFKGYPGIFRKTNAKILRVASLTVPWYLRWIIARRI